MAGESFTGSSLEQALREGTLARGGKIIVVCMVKASDTQGHISITASGCERWADVSADMIERAELVGHRACKEHEHPLVRITFKEARSAEGQIFATLLSQITEAGLGPGIRPFPEGLRAGNPLSSRAAISRLQGGQLPFEIDCLGNYAQCRSWLLGLGVSYGDAIRQCALDYWGCTVLNAELGAIFG